MTIDSQYSQESFNINASNTYIITFESAGPETIYVYGVNTAGLATIISNNGYTLNMGGLPPIYDGATLIIDPLFYPPGTIEILVVRDTPVTQLVDLEPYTSFPAETLEFSLDKLTLIQQEQGKGDSSGGQPSPPFDPNLYVPISGTRVGVPMTGTLEMNQGNLQNWRFGPVGNPFNFFTVANLKTGLDTEPFVVSVNNLYTVFDPSGDVYLSTVYDQDTPTNAAATIQYVEDAIGGPGGAFIPLAGTAPGADVTGPIQFENTTLGVDGTFGILENLTDLMTLYSNGDILLATGSNAPTQWFGFGEDGVLQLPDLDYTLVDGLSAVNKAYVDSVAGGGGGGDFVPLAGTEAAKPITGTFTFQDVALNREFSMGIFNVAGFDNGFTIAAAGSSGDPSNIYLTTGGTAVYEFGPDEALFNVGLEVAGPLVGNAGLLTTGILCGGGAQFNGGVTINDADLNIVNAQLNAQGVLCDDIVCAGLINTGNTNSNTITINQSPTQNNQATRKDYVDGLNATNVKTTGNQTVGGIKTFSSTILASGINVTGGALLGIVQPALGGATKYIKCDSGGGFFSSNTLQAADVELPSGAMLTDFAVSTLGDLNTARERIEALEAGRDAIIARLEAAEARILALENP